MTAVHRAALPQLGTSLLLADGGLETWLERAGRQLTEFAAFPLLATPDGRAALRSYYQLFLDLAVQEQRGIVLDTPTWRAGSDWGTRLGYDHDTLAAANRAAVQLLVELRASVEASGCDVVVSGCVGPRHDEPTDLTAAQARDHHAPQLEVFAGTAADLATAMTLPTAAEAIGVARAATDVGLPVAISFTTGGDGRLPDGTPLARAIATVDEQTDAAPAYYLVNCAHPSDFLAALDAPECRERVRGVRANAAEQDGDAPDAGARDLAGWYLRVRDALPAFTVAGGCCGTDERHVAAISAALRP